MPGLESLRSAPPYRGGDGDHAEVHAEGGLVQNGVPSPGFWIKQKKSERSFLSMSPTFEQYRTMRVLFDHMRKDFGDEDNYKSLQTDPVNIRKDKLVQKAPSTETKVKAESNEHEEPETDIERPAEAQQGELAWEEAGLPLPAGWRVYATRLAPWQQARVPAPCCGHSTGCVGIPRPGRQHWNLVRFVRFVRIRTSLVRLVRFVIIRTRQNKRTAKRTKWSVQTCP